jgi:outer membrane protein TolC
VLNRTLGVAVNTPTQVLDITPPVDIAQVDVESSINAAHERRPEVRAARTAIALNQRNVKLQRTGLLPSLQVGANAFYNVETTTFMSENVNWNAVLTLSVPIWDGGVTRARVQQARADVANAVDTLDQTRLEVGLDVRTAALNLEEASRRTQTTASAVVLAEEALRLANVRYDAGIATLVEVTNAESQLTQARFNFVNAQYDYAVALAQLQRATSTQPELNQLQLLGGSVPSI